MCVIIQGARPHQDGADGIHTHMTNTMNSPIEALEYAYPLLVKQYKILRNSGGAGRWRGGNGIRRDLELLDAAKGVILSERRKFSPYGLAGGQTGQRGSNIIIREGEEKQLPGKVTFDLKPGDIISLRTPGGGGYGKV